MLLVLARATLLLLLLAPFATRLSFAQENAAQPVVRVFVLAGQSNMEGQGVVDLDHEKHYNGGQGILNRVMRAPSNVWRYAHVASADGKWVERDDVFVRYRVKSGLKRGKLTIGFTGYDGKHHIGPEFQFGHVVGDAIDEPVLLIKTAWGGKSLYKDFRPPSAGGETGPYYEQMLREVDEALAVAHQDFPALAGRTLRVDGFVWMQGWNDMFDEDARSQYEQNLVHLIHEVRKHFDNATLPVVVGELGNGGTDAGQDMLRLREAQRRATQRPEFRETVAFVPTIEFARPANKSPNTGHGHHWFGNAESYFLIGDALGRATLELLDIGHRVEKDIAYKVGSDDYGKERCKLDLYVPTGAKDAPTIVWFHGGGLTAGSKDRVESLVAARHLADHGIIVANVSYRLSPRAKYPAYIEDAAAAVAWTINHVEDFGGDRNRVYVGGHSAGAYLTMMVGMDATYLAKHDANLSQIAGLIPVSGQTDSHWTVRDERGIDRNQQVIDASAPLHHVNEEIPPMLLITADDDLKGRIALNERLLKAMERAGHTRTTLHVIPNRGHTSLITLMPKPADRTSKLIVDFVGASESNVVR